MKKAFLVMAIALMAVAMLATPLASAVPVEEKNNDKFQTFSVVGTFSFLKFLTGPHQYMPSTDQVNKLIIEFDETMLIYDITIDQNTYHLGTDFAYSGHAKFWYDDPVFGYTAFGMLYPSGYRGEYHAIVEYTFDFSAVPGGIEGTLNMRAIHNAGGNPINSLVGTGDLQNVQVKAEITGNVFNPATLQLTIFHEGLVSGWPE